RLALRGWCLSLWLLTAWFVPTVAWAAAREAESADVVLLSEAASRAKEGSDVSAHFVADVGHASVLELTGAYDRDVDGEFNAAAREAVAREYLRTHADAYDFLVVFTGFDFSRGGDGVLAFYLGIRN